ncbi:hypothetical protein MHBO_001448, partial [Bonamia ostreae]
GRYAILPSYNELRLVESEDWTSETKISPEKQIGEILFSVWSPNDNFAASIGPESKITIWDLCLSKSVFSDKISSVTSIAWPSDDKLCLAKSDGTLSYFDVSQFNKNDGKSSNSTQVLSNEKEVPETQLSINDSDEQNRSRESNSEDDFELVDDLEKINFDSFETNSNQKKPISDFKSDSKNSEDDYFDRAGNEKIAFGSESEDIDAFIDNGNEETTKKPKKSSKRKSLAEQKSEKMAKTWNEHEKTDRKNIETFAFKSPQKAFQSSCTPFVGDRRYLVWNLAGSVTMIRGEDNCVVDIELSDVSLYKQDKIVDDHIFEFACLCFLFAIFSRKGDIFGG